MANPQTLSVNPQGTGGPSVGQKILPLSVFSFPAGIAEHMVVFIPGMQVNLQQHDCTLFQCSFHPAFRDPWMKMNRNILFHADSAKTPAQVKGRHKIGSAAEPAKQVFVPVGMHAPADIWPFPILPFAARLCRERTMLTMAVGLQCRVKPSSSFINCPVVQ